MAHIKYESPDQVPDRYRVADEDNILAIHRVHPRSMRDHYELYVTLMRRPGPLTGAQREMIAVVVSAINECEY